MRVRLDHALVQQGLVTTRSRARDVISRGLVTVGGTVIMKAGTLIDLAAALAVTPDAGTAYVSRGALKLKAAFDTFGFSAEGRTALDVGASTGGFTQVLLERGARKVYAVDVGHGQLTASLRHDPRVVSLERQDVRTLTKDLVPELADAIVADVSFISLEKALPAALALAAPGAWLIALVKPQFEVGPEHVGKGGIVRDESRRGAAVSRVQAWIDALAGWRVAGVVASPIEGGSGNREYLLGAARDA